jgi:mRNA-decapping enzyme 1B
LVEEMATPLSEEARRQANLKILQRKDNSICDILASATHVGLYEYNMNQWEKKPVEGSLFLVSRQPQDIHDPIQYQLQILNRLSTDHWTMPIVDPTMQLQQQDPYLILRFRHGEKTVIQGIWFPNGQERAVMANALTRLLPTLSSVPSNSIPSVATTSTTTARRTSAPTTTATEAAAVTALLSPLTLGGHVIPVSMAPSSGNAKSNSQNTPTLSPQGNLPQPSSLSSSASQAASNPLDNPHLVLDKRSLQLTLLSLLHDDRFLDLIHVQYLKVAHARANRSNEESSSSKTSGG